MADAVGIRMRLDLIPLQNCDGVLVRDEDVEGIRIGSQYILHGEQMEYTGDQIELMFDRFYKEVKQKWHSGLWAKFKREWMNK